MREEEKYLEIREKLRNLPEIKASNDFFAKLQHKIAEIDSTETIYAGNATTGHQNESGFFQRLFDRRENPWLIPVSGFAVVILLVGIFYFSSANNPIGTQENENETMTQVSPDNENDIAGNDTKDELKQMKTETIPSESIAENTTENIESPVATTTPPETKTESSVQQESRSRPEVKMDVESTTSNEEKINENFRTSALEKNDAKPSNSNEVSVTTKKEDTNRIARSRRSPVQVSTIKQGELENLREKISD